METLAIALVVIAALAFLSRRAVKGACKKGGCGSCGCSHGDKTVKIKSSSDNH